jgi:hypothetical protein
MPPRQRFYFLLPLSGSPVELQSNRIYTFGRSPECEIVVNDVQASRRHAELRFDLEQFALVDLSSRNGTYVGGRRIREKTLHNGDQIRIGAHTFTYVIRTDRQGGDTFVQLEERSRRSETLSASALIQEQEDGGIMGSLGQFPPLELIQFLNVGSRSGVLEVVVGESKGHFWFDAGTLVDAEMNEQTGEPALLQLAQLSAGFFSFQPSGAAKLRTPTITRPTPALLLDISRTLDEQATQDGQ